MPEAPGISGSMAAHWSSSSQNSFAIPSSRMNRKLESYQKPRSLTLDGFPICVACDSMIDAQAALALDSPADAPADMSDVPAESEPESDHTPTPPNDPDPDPESAADAAPMEPHA